LTKEENPKVEFRY